MTTKGLTCIYRTSVPVNTVSKDTLLNLSNEISDNTERAYKSDFEHFNNWLEKSQYELSPPHSPACVSDYVSFMGSKGYAMKTIDRRLRAISFAYKKEGDDNPPSNSELVKATVKGLKRRRAKEGKRTTVDSKQPATADIIKLMVDQIDTSNINGVRDKALLLVGWAAALRRSELVALKYHEVVITPQGADILIGMSKTDQEGEGATVSITRGSENYCPVRALLDYLKQAEIRDGYLSRRHYRGGRVSKNAFGAKSVATMVKKYCEAAGFDPSRFSGHSLRSGMLTSAAESGSDLIPLAQHARHKNYNITMHYIRKANRYRNNPTAGLL